MPERMSQTGRALVFALGAVHFAAGFSARAQTPGPGKLSAHLINSYTAGASNIRARFDPGNAVTRTPLGARNFAATSGAGAGSGSTGPA